MTNFPRPLPADEQKALEQIPRRQVPLQRQLINLALIMAAVVVPFVVTGNMPVLLMIGCLAFFIMFHEFAHFAVAKASGMKVTEFFIGFGPRLFSIRRGETEYGIKAIPAGGYVKIIGMSSTEEVDDADEQRTYRRQRWYKRVATILAGPASHFLMAFVLLVAIFGFTGTPMLSNEIGKAEPGFPAEAAGLRTGDRVTSIQGVPADDWEDVLVSLDSIKTPVVDLTVVGADGATRELAVTRKAEVNNGVTRWVLGIRPAKQVYVTESLPKSFSLAGSTLIDYSGQTVSGVTRFFSPSTLSGFFKQVRGAHNKTGDLTQEELESRPTSIIGMTQVGAEAAKQGPTELMEILVVINLALGTFNLLPMLPLDGGHIVVATYESVMGKFRKKRHFANMERLTPFVAAFFGLLMMLGVGAMYLDIVRPIF
jgi:membrane-associated protease RseP (regulator of RpoE activity)